MPDGTSARNAAAPAYAADSDRSAYLVQHDPLTGLPSRALFLDRLDQAIHTAHRLGRGAALLLLHIERLRLINDTHGHAAGDRALVEVAHRLAAQAREGDTVARISGNEFCLLLANLGQDEDIIGLAQRAMETVTAELAADGPALTIAASLGISVFPRDGENGEALLKAADSALMRSQQAGHNAFCFYSPGMNADASRRLALEAALRQALARNELALHYQPQVLLDSGHICGMEALLRWTSADLGPVPPDEFIPVAEETGLIVAIGEWVLRTACAQNRAWQEQGLPPLRVAVNVSARQFRQDNLLPLVTAVLAETGLQPACLELEVTESAFMDDVEQAIALCHRLKALGVKLSLDDFGTGYSSLAYVSRFPFDKLKIDRAFVRDITENPVNAAITTAAIVMSRSLGFSVLAEGVETEAQAAFLHGRGCDAMQGYLFSRPLPAADFAALLADEKSLALTRTSSGGEQTLLVVDDEEFILSALQRLLRREGYQVLSAASPAAAFEILARQPVQVVVSDHRMPEMTGTEFLARVRRLYPHTVRIILSGYADLQAVTEAINRGAIYKFLTKPWNEEQLREQLREAFRVSRSLQPD